MATNERDRNAAHRLAESETVLGSAAQRAVEAERRRLGVDDEPGDRAALWGRRVGRALGWGAAVALVVWLFTTYGRG